MLSVSRLFGGKLGENFENGIVFEGWKRFVGKEASNLKHQRVLKGENLDDKIQTHFRVEEPNLNAFLRAIQRNRAKTNPISAWTPMIAVTFHSKTPQKSFTLKFEQFFEEKLKISL